jgi:ABC-type Na+ transport system ATPase subunit NatA
MVPLAFLVSTLLNQTGTATTLGFAIFLIGVMIQSFTGLIYQDTTDLVWRVLFAFLPFAMLAKGLGDLGSYTDSALKSGLRFNDVGSYGFFPLTDVYWWLAVDFGVYLVIALYLDNVLYSRRKLWFFLQPSYWTGAAMRPTSKPDDEEKFVVEDVDEDVRAEENYIKSNQLNDNDAVIIDNVVKTYQSKLLGCIPDGSKPFRAVKGVYLTIQKGSLLCLLGHNGAGKSTTIKMMTGLFGPTSGDATVFGHSIIDGMNEIRQVMGVCPQHDILWRQLTAREHLELFAGLKDLDPELIAGEVAERLVDVSLTAAADIPAGSYSGGMKRRLSVAIALIGDPKIVFLDEPTYATFYFLNRSF